MVDCNGLENRQQETVREFESHTPRQNCPNGEIGRHKGLKIPRLKLYGFESRFGHQKLLKGKKK